jgi:hypothetical protein
MRCFHRTRPLLPLAALAAASWLLTPGTAGATVVIQPSLAEMTARSGVVVRGLVEEVTVTTGESDKRVLTLTRIRVLEAVKGPKAGDTVTLYQVGGQLGNFVSRMVGMSPFSRGEEVVLFGATFLAQDTVKFLQDNRKGSVPDATLRPSGGWMVMYGIGVGKFLVERDNALPLPMVIEQMGDVEVAHQRAEGLVFADQAVRTRQPLPVFMQEVRRLAATPARRAP